MAPDGGKRSAPTGTWVTVRYYTREEIVERLEVDSEFLVSLERESVIAADAPSAEPGEYSDQMLERIRVAHNLVRDLDVNLPGAGIIVRMRERLLGQRQDLELVLRELERARRGR